MFCTKSTGEHEVQRIRPHHQEQHQQPFEHHQHHNPGFRVSVSSPTLAKKLVKILCYFSLDLRDKVMTDHAVMVLKF
jgi:hypothetical protein